MGDRLLGRLCRRAHHHQNPLCVRAADIVEEAVPPSEEGGKPVHHLLDDPGRRQVEGIDALSRLEEDVRVLGRPADERPIGRERPLAVSPYQIVVDHRSQVVLCQNLDLADLVRGAETVEDVEERNAGLEGACLRDQGQVHDFLNRV